MATFCGLPYSPYYRERDFAKVLYNVNNVVELDDLLQNVSKLLDSLQYFSEATRTRLNLHQRASEAPVKLQIFALKEYVNAIRKKKFNLERYLKEKQNAKARNRTNKQPPTLENEEFPPLPKSNLLELISPALATQPTDIIESDKKHATGPDNSSLGNASSNVLSKHTGTGTTDTQIDTPKEAEEDFPFMPAKRTCRSLVQASSPIKIANSFSTLDTEEVDVNSAKEDGSTSSFARRPPPIYIDVPEDPTDLMNELCTINGSNIEASLTKGQLKIFAMNEEAYNNIKNFLKTEEFNFFTFTPKSKRPVKYVLKGIPHATDTQDIADSLSDLGFAIEKVSLLYQPRARVAPPPFVVALDPASKHLNILQLKKVFFYRVKFERLRRRKGLMLCYVCYQEGHTSHECFRQAICTICGQEHNYKDCPRPTEPLSCGRCKTDGHSIRDRSCPELKKLLQKMKSNGEKTRQQQPFNGKSRTSTRVNEAKSFAGSTSPNIGQENTPPAPLEASFKMNAVPSFLKAHENLKKLPAGEPRMVAILDAYAALFAVFA